MNIPRVVNFFFSLLVTTQLWSQAIDNTSSQRDMHHDRYMRFNYENDFFAATDYYYTQGIYFEMVHPGLAKFPLSYLLLRPENAETRFGIAVEHDAYTPTNIVASSVLDKDRPFAAALYLKSFAIAINSENRSRLSTSLSTGILGPAAGGEEMQVYIHEHTGNAIPLGWHNQVANDVILNYQINYEKELLASAGHFLMSATGMVRAGTLSDVVQLGLNTMAGIFDSPYDALGAGQKKYAVYLYMNPTLSLVAYDATMQGGVFNRDSPYTIQSADINRVVLRNNVGICFKLSRFYLEYYVSQMTRDFKNGRPHGNGGIQVGFNI